MCRSQSSTTCRHSAYKINQRKQFRILNFEITVTPEETQAWLTITCVYSQGSISVEKVPARRAWKRCAVPRMAPSLCLCGRHISCSPHWVRTGVPILPSWKITCLPFSVDSAIPTQQDSIFSIDQGLLWVYPFLTLHSVHIEHPKFGVIGH